MHSIAVILLWIIAFMTLLLDVSATRLIKFISSKCFFNESNCSKKEKETDSAFKHSLMIWCFILLIIWIVLQMIWKRLCHLPSRGLLVISVTIVALFTIALYIWNVSQYRTLL